MSILELKNICYTYGVGTPFEKKAVNDVSFSVNKGELIGIIGHTGSGKSTLVQMLNGLMKPTSGQVLLDGVDIWDKPKEIRKIRFKVGMVFQYPEYQLFEETVYKDISFGPFNKGLSQEEIDKLTLEIANQRNQWICAADSRPVFRPGRCPTGLAQLARRNLFVCAQCGGMDIGQPLPCRAWRDQS